MGFGLGSLIGGALGGVGSYLGAKEQAKAAKKAAKINLQMFNTLNGQQQPFIQGGYASNNRLLELLGIQPPGSGVQSFDQWSAAHPDEGTLAKGMAGIQGKRTYQSEAERRAAYDQYASTATPYEKPDDFGAFTKPFDAETFAQYQDPGYQFRKQQGEQGVLNSAAAGSGALSGAALKDLLSFNQDLASTEYGNAFNRYQTQQGNIFQRLSGIAGMGQNAAANVGSQGTALAGNAGQAYQNYGSALGGGIVGAGNALGQGASDYFLLNRLLKGG